MGVARLNPRKVLLARSLHLLGLDSALVQLQRVLWRPHLRVVNYHDVPESQAAAFEAQLGYFARRFVPVGPPELESMLAGEWPHRRPGLLISFDDGFRSHAEVAAPRLERFGFPGWFFVPTAFPDVPEHDQFSWARDHQILPRSGCAGERVAMTWEQIRRLEERHVVGCHTMYHVRLGESLTADELDREIVQAKAGIEQQLGHQVSSFCWVGGEEWAYCTAAAERIRAAGFRWSFMTNNAVVRPGDQPLQIQRTNLEADWPTAVWRFQLCGVLDLAYWPKRRRVVRKTAAGAAPD